MNTEIKQLPDIKSHRQYGDFVNAAELPLIDSPQNSYTDDLEKRIQEQDSIIAEQRQLIEELQSNPLPARMPSDELKDSERLILLARINDLTIANNAQEIELRQAAALHSEQIEIALTQIARLKERVSCLEGQPINPTAKQDARLKKLDRILVERGNQPLTFSEVGKYIELGRRVGEKNTRRQAMTKFSKILASKNDCYVISEGKTVNAKLVRLTDGYFKKLRRV